MKWTRPSASSKRIGRSFCQIPAAGRTSEGGSVMKEKPSGSYQLDMGSGKRITRFICFYALPDAE